MIQKLKRLYFTDAIHALYMQKEFGVKFECKNSDEEIQEYDLKDDDIFFPFDESMIDQPDHIGELIGELQNFRNIYVTKESEYIFLPKEGDEGRVVGRLGTFYLKYINSQWVGHGINIEQKTKIIMNQ